MFGNVFWFASQALATQPTCTRVYFHLCLVQIFFNNSNCAVRALPLCPSTALNPFGSLFLFINHHVIFIIQFLCSKTLTGNHAPNPEFTFQVDSCIPYPHSTHSCHSNSIHIWCIWMQNAQLMFASKCIRNGKKKESVSASSRQPFIVRLCHTKRVMTSRCHLWIVSANGMQFEREEWKSGLNRLTDRDNNCFRKMQKSLIRSIKNMQQMGGCENKLASHQSNGLTVPSVQMYAQVIIYADWGTGSMILRRHCTVSPGWICIFVFRLRSNTCFCLDNGTQQIEDGKKRSKRKQLATRFTVEWPFAHIVCDSNERKM